MSSRDVPFGAEDGKSKTCPICSKPQADSYAPFCSKRCADVDLGRWLGGVYAVPDDDPGRNDALPGDAEEQD